MDWSRLHARYARLDWQRRLGNLSSTLARAATAADNPRTVASVPDLLREGMWVIEWSQADTPLNVLMELALVQRELGLLTCLGAKPAGHASGFGFSLPCHG